MVEHAVHQLSFPCRGVPRAGALDPVHARPRQDVEHERHGEKTLLVVDHSPQYRGQFHSSSIVNIFGRRHIDWRLQELVVFFPTSITTRC